MKNSDKKWISGLRSRFILGTVIFTLTITVISLAVVYYWSFYHFANIFEDRVIDEYTFQKKQDMGVANEWILGVTTHSIDVVRGIHGDKTADRLEERAMNQQELTKLYREKVDGKHLLYMIDLDTRNGETIYEYSIIKDIYAEIFPKIVMGFVLLSLILAGASVAYTQYIAKGLYSDIRKLRAYTKRVAQGRDAEDLQIETRDREFENLVSDLQIMKKTIDDDAAIRQSTLQYISHEMKTPIMIIEGYAASAQDEIYPKGSLQSTLTTILTQTERMKQKVTDLLTIVHLESAKDKEIQEKVPLKDCVQEVFRLLSGKLGEKTYQIDLDDQILLLGNREKMKILFENLISNQIKYAEKQFTISMQTEQQRLRLFFYNDGPAIPKELRNQLFQPFVKGYNGSSGLGLSICRTILRQIGGDITLEDREIGTMFTLVIPSSHWTYLQENDMCRDYGSL